MSKSAFELVAETDALIHELMTTEGEVNDVILERMLQHDDDVKDLCRRYRYVAKGMEAKVKHLKDEAKRLTDAARTLDRGARMFKQRARDVLLAHEELTGEHKVSYDGGSAWLVRRDVIVLAGEQDLFDELTKKGIFTECTSLSISVRKDEIKKRLADGLELDNARLEQTTSITLR